jgi:16S rRNA G966 N2-methylase RsmD
MSIAIKTTTPEIKVPKTFATSLNGVDLSFAGIREYERTKHVHRLHPYLGKFIPQLVEVFLNHYFGKGDSILDPFMGSGTTLIEANVLGMHSAGVEISLFNCLIADIKTRRYKIPLVENEIKDILSKTKEYSKWLLRGQKQATFLENSFKKYKIDSEYLNAWLSDRALQEILFYRDQIKNYKNQDILKIILSRATRSARLIPHYDLARPAKPIREKYYCIKHRRTCEPINEAMKFINRYSWDTIRRIKEFDKLRTNATIKIIQGDSREVDLSKVNGYKGGKFDGIFTSPPYVGLIDYHDQHRYAYELFGFDDNGFKEIGPASKGRSHEAREEYKNDIIAVFQNMDRFLRPKAKIFVVVNDRDNLYPEVASVCGYSVEKIFHRPVLMRTERDNTRFSESIYYFIKQ